MLPGARGSRCASIGLLRLTDETSPLTLPEHDVTGLVFYDGAAVIANSREIASQLGQRVLLDPKKTSRIQAVYGSLHASDASSSQHGRDELVSIADGSSARRQLCAGRIKAAVLSNEMVWQFSRVASVCSSSLSEA